MNGKSPAFAPRTRNFINIWVLASPPTARFSDLIKNSREKTPGKKYVFNFVEVKLPISRPIPV